MSMAVIGVVAVVAGTGIAAYGQYQAGQSQKAMADYNAKLARNEAIARDQATAAETERMRSEKKRMISAQRAAAGKTGAMISEGTPLLVMAEDAGLMELDILNMKRTGAMQAQASRSEATLSKYEGKQAARAGMIGAGSTLLSGFGTAAGMASNIPRDAKTGKMFMGSKSGKG